MAFLERGSTRYWAAAAAAFATGMLFALISVARRRGFGAGDLGAFALWLAPFALAAAWASGQFAARTQAWPRVRRSLAGTALGATLGVAWSLLVRWALGPFFGAFSFAMTDAFVLSGVVCLLAPLTRPAPVARRR